MWRTLGLVGLMALPLKIAAGQPLSTDQVRRIDSVFAPFDGTSRPGCALGIARNGNPAYSRGYGMADLQNGLAIRPQSIFHVASISKQFAAVAVALLAQDGKLSLDDDVRKYLPELPDYGAKLTIRHLIYHTSGIRDHWELLGMAGWRYPTDLFTQQDVLDIVVRQKALNFRPGDEWMYSNSGYALIAVIVKRVSGQTLRAFSEERIFGPLGMTMTHVHDDHAMIVPGRTAAYQSEAGNWKISIPNFDTHGATSLFTTVGDLLKWEENFTTATVGGRALLDEAETSALLNNGKPTNYGFGISIENFRGVKAFGHGGADAGYRADVVRFPAQHLAIAVNCNFAEATPNAYSRAVAAILLGDQLTPMPAAKPAGTVTLALTRLAQLAGVYQSRGSDQAFRFAVKEARLVLENYGVPLEPVDESHFTVFGTPITFDGVPGAEPVSVRLGREPVDSMMRVPMVTPDPSKLGDYAGEYWSDELRVSYSVAVKDGALMLHRFKADPEPMSPLYQDAFLNSGDVVRFTRLKGRVTGFRVTGGRVRNVAFSKGVNRP
jgi:CubicO group peptidase (beta-lactamase class C family)